MATKGIDDCLKKLKAEVDIEPEVEYYLRAKARPYLDQGIPEIEAFQKAILEFQKETIETVKSVYAQVGAKGYSQKEGAETASATGTSEKEAAPISTVVDEKVPKEFTAEGGNKVVNESGEPIIVYHGSKEPFSQFDESKIGLANDHGIFGVGFYFTPSKSEAKDFSGIGTKGVGESVDMREPFIYEAHLSIKNPLVVYNDKELSKEEAMSLTKQAKEDGHDGIIVKIKDDVVKGEPIYRNWYIAFDNKQIKKISSPTQQQTSTPIGESKEEKAEIPKQQKINDLVERVNVFNKMPRNAKGRSQEINSIRVAANELGLRFDDRSGELFNKNGGKVKKVNADAPRKAAEGFDQENYSQETRQHFETVKKNLDALTGLPITGADGRLLNRNQLEAAVKSIEDGKPNNAAKAIFDYIESAVNEGNVEITDKVTGERATIPVDDYFDAFKEPVTPLTDDEIMQLNYELDQDSLNFENEDYGQETIPTKVEPATEGSAAKGQNQTGGGKEAARSGAKTQESQEVTEVGKPPTKTPKTKEEIEKLPETDREAAIDDLIFGEEAELSPDDITRPEEAVIIPPFPKANGTVREVLQYLIDNVNKFSGLAKEILETADSESLSVPVEFNRSLGGRSKYLTKLDTVRMDNRSSKDATVIIHEIIHATTARKIPTNLKNPSHGNSYGKAYLKELQDYLKDENGDKDVKTLIRLYLKAVDSLGFNKLLFEGESQVRRVQNTGRISYSIAGQPIYAEFNSNDSREAAAIERALKSLGIEPAGSASVGYGYGWSTRVGSKNVQKLLDSVFLKDKKTDSFGATWFSYDFSYEEKGRATAGNQDLTYKKGAPYGLGNLDEFLAEAFSSQSFQLKLASIKDENGYSIWQRFVNAIRKMIGNFEDATLLSNVIKTGASIIAKKRNATFERLSELSSPVNLEAAKERMRKAGYTDTEIKNEFEKRGLAFEPPTKEPPSKPPAEDEDVIADEEDEKPSGIKKALVSSSIIKSVDLDKVSDEEMMALGRKILDTGEVNPRALVQKITTERKGVLTPAEVVALITYKADLDNKLRDTYTEINKRNESGEEISTLGVEAKNLERDILDFDIMSVITAQQQSLAFRLRQQMLDRDYNVVTEIEKYKANNGGYIPPDVEEKFKELGKQLKEVKEKLAEAEKRASEKEAQEAVDNIKDSVDREKKYTDEEVEKKIEKGVQDEINKIYQQLPGDKKSLADKAIAALDKIQKNLRGKQYSDVTGFVAIIDAGITTIKNAIKLGVSIKEAVELGIKKIKERLGGKDWPKEDEFRKDMIDGFEAEGVSVRKDKPVVNDDGTVTIPNKVLRDLVEKGVTDINELTDAVYSQVVNELPGVTKRQIRDYITDYGRKVNPTADDIQQQVNEAKRIGRLLSQLEDLMNRKRKEKNPSTHAKLTEKERELKRQIKSLEKDIFGKEELTDEQKLSNAKESVRARIAELDRRIKNKDFAKPKKKLGKSDDELAALNAEKEKLQDQFDDEQYKLTLKNRTFWQKAEDVLLELTSGLVRGLVASLDLSAGLVQGFYRLFTNPVNSIRAYGVMFKHLISENNSQDFLNKLKAQKYYPLLQASKLAIDDKAGRVSAKEGLFISNWINFIWDKVISNVLGLGTKPGVKFFRKINPYAASQRAFDGYVNSIRVQSFLQLAKELERDGYKFEADQRVFEKAADFVNTTTGRGSLGAADASSKWLNIFLFAPRKVISEIKLFTPYAFVYYARMPKAVRKKALINFAKFAASYFGVNALLWAARKDWDDDEEDNFWNMNSSDFLTHKIGNKRVSIGGGMKSALVMQGRLWSGDFTDQYGNTTKLGDRFGKQINTRLDLMWRYVLGKASPALGVVAKKLDERKGLEVDDDAIMKDLTIPIWLQDIKDLYKESPETVSGLLTFLSILGANARSVDQTKRTQKTIKIYDPKTRTSRESTPEEYKQYTDLRDKKAKKMLDEIKETGVMFDEYGEITVNKDNEKSRRNRRKFESLSEQEQKDLMTKINNSVDDKAKAELKFFTKQQAQGQN